MKNTSSALELWIVMKNTSSVLELWIVMKNTSSVLELWIVMKNTLTVKLTIHGKNTLNIYRTNTSTIHRL